MDESGFEPETFSMQMRRDTTTPFAQMFDGVLNCLGKDVVGEQCEPVRM